MVMVMVVGLIQIGPETRGSLAEGSCRSLTALKNLLLRFREFLIGQHTGSVQLCQLTQLDREVRSRCWRSRGCSRWHRRRCSRRLLLLHLLDLLLHRLLLLEVLHLRLLLGSRILPGVSLLLMMADGAGCADDHCRGCGDAYCAPKHPAAHHPSSWSEHGADSFRLG